MYYVNIASSKIVNKYGNQIGYIDYNTKLSKFPSVGEVILMHNEYVGRVKKITFDSNQFDALIWIDTVYHINDIDENDELKYPTFDAGTIIK